MNPPVQSGSREGFSKLTFLTNVSRGREALKCALPPKTRRQDRRPFIRVWFRVASPSILHRPRATDSQMGGRSTSAATPHTKWRCRRDRVATFSVGPDGVGEGNAAATPFATTPCRYAARACTADSVRPRAARPVAGAGCVTGAARACCPPSPCGSHSPGSKPGVRGGGEGRGPENFEHLENRGEPLAKFWSPGTRDGRHRSTPPPPPYPPRLLSHIRIQALSLPNPLHTRFPAGTVDPPRGGRTAGSGRTSHAACAGHRPCGPRPDRVCRARPCSGSAGRSGK